MADSGTNPEELDCKLTARLKELKDVGLHLETRKWSELNRAAQLRAFYAANRMLNEILFVYKNKIVFGNEVKEKITPDLIRSLRPIWFCICQTAQKYRTFKKKIGFTVFTGRLQQIIFRLSRHPLEDTFNENFKKIKEVTEYFDNSIDSWSRMGHRVPHSDSESEELEEVVEADIRGMPNSHTWWWKYCPSLNADTQSLYE